MAAIIDHYFTAPLEAEHELITRNMGVISPVFGAWYRIDHKIALRNERQAATQFSNGQVTPRVWIVGQMIQPDALHTQVVHTYCRAGGSYLHGLVLLLSLLILLVP